MLGIVFTKSFFFFTNSKRMKNFRNMNNHFKSKDGRNRVFNLCLYIFIITCFVYVYMFQMSYSFEERIQSDPEIRNQFRPESTTDHSIPKCKSSF